MNTLALQGTYKTSMNSERSGSLEVGSERKLGHLKDSLPFLVRNKLGEVTSLSSAWYILVYLYGDQKEIGAKLKAMEASINLKTTNSSNYLSKFKSYHNHSTGCTLIGDQWKTVKQTVHCDTIEVTA